MVWRGLTMMLEHICKLHIQLGVARWFCPRSLLAKVVVCVRSHTTQAAAIFHSVVTRIAK